jgi:hypothetical protein
MAPDRYSLCLAVVAATSRAGNLPTTCGLLSMPAAIPAEQTIQPLATKRRSARTGAFGAVRHRGIDLD